jgi:hypothetical protein
MRKTKTVEKESEKKQETPAHLSRVLSLLFMSFRLLLPSATPSHCKSKAII